MRRQDAWKWVLAMTLGLALLGLTACDEEKTAPKLLPFEAQEVAVNQTLTIPLLVENPDNLSLEYRVSDPKLPSFDEVSSLSTTPPQFNWTPLASHVGTHEIFFEVSSSAGSDKGSVIVTVIPAASAAPVFLRPGFGGTYDIAKEPCVSFDIEVRDDDSLSVDIRARQSLPLGATLESVDGSSKRAAFQWCPSQEQIQRSLRWTIALEADDGDHEPTPHDHLVVLRTPAKDNCPGDPPVVSIDSPSEGQVIQSSGGYPVEITVIDDQGMRDPPILYYSESSPSDEPSISDFDQQRVFEKLESGNAWRAFIPPLELAEGETRSLYLMVSATDNDDASGTACDHTVETGVIKFGVSNDGATLAGDCSLCNASSDCESGICAAEKGGVCLPACGSGCVKGTCAEVVTPIGATVDACTDFAAVCEGGGGDECANDSYEPNEASSSAKAMSALVEGVICPGDTDVFSYSASTDTQFHFLLSDFNTQEADLDLSLSQSDGTMLALSSSEGELEEAVSCLHAGQTAYVSVYAYGDQEQSGYSLVMETSEGACCENDEWEPDNTLGDGAAVLEDYTFIGTSCPLDTDIRYFDVDQAQVVNIMMEFEIETGDLELDLELYDASGSFMKGAWEDGLVEELEVELPLAGRYYLMIKPYGLGEALYIGEMEFSPIGDCLSTYDCPNFHVCAAGSCVSDLCEVSQPCPSGHICEPAGPEQSYSYCVADCSQDSDCRSGEACKYFAEGRGCAVKGTASLGDACVYFEDCAGQRACYPWPGGYCARLGCSSDADCEDDAFCAQVDEQSVCLQACVSGDECRLTEGYSCAEATPVAGGSRMACVP